MNEHRKSPGNIYLDIQKEITNGVIDRFHGFHLPTFSNISSNGSANSRIVVIRDYNHVQNYIFFHTDIRSSKIKDINSNPKTAFLFYDFKIKTQLRIKTISKFHNNNKISKIAWEKTKLSSRKCYLANSPPGSFSQFPTDDIPKNLTGIDPTYEESENGYKNFTVVESKIQSIEWLFLSSKGHKRLFVGFNENNKKFQWLIP